MLVRWEDLPRSFAGIDEFRRRMNRAIEEQEVPRWSRQTNMWPERGWPTINLHDDGNELFLQAEVPGLSEQDIQLSLNQNVLSISGERNVDAPKDYAVHRQERVAIKFARSFSLPCQVDPEKVAAQVKDGVLTVSMEKAKEAQPRKITVKAS
jgi:HSP20 family protein